METKSRSCAIASVVLLVLLGCALGESNIFEGSQQEVDVKKFLSEICDNSSPLMSVTVKSFDVDHSDRSLEHVCKEGNHGLLLWVKSTHFADLPELEPGLKYVGRAAFDEEFNGFCTYDLSTQVCSNGDGEVSAPVVILGEKYPERYELRDMVFKKWTNSTRLGSPILAYATLKNRDTAYKYIDQDISYLSDMRMEFQLPATVIASLPLSVYRGKVETYKTISGETYYGRSFKTINAVRYMSPATIINVTVVGTEERAYREFRGKLVSIYTDEEGFGWSRSLLSVEGASIETTLTETHVEYGVVANLYDESQLQPGAPTLSPSIPHTDHKYPGQSNSPKAEGIHIHISETELNQVYPGFRNIAIGAAILFFSVVGIALLDIIRRVFNNRRAKRLRLGKYSKVNGS
ncbi:enolase-binding protein-like [Ochlerotatus camptorhynchus]|uniref:enolase-binding protein-like n=1 Tax=Ochlerotatus camptorhynchus TaxID=644619 RepID=UPI0031D89600